MVIDDAMRTIEKENTTLKNVLPKNYASPDLDKRVLGNVDDLFSNMDMGGTEESKDLLGRTYEYCIQQFAAYEGVKGGEFYTPASIVKTIFAILRPFNICRVDVRWKHGTPPAGNADYAWIQHMIHHIAPKGKIGLVLANGALSSQSGGEGEIRKNIIQADLVEGIVAIPAQLFYSVTIPVTLCFISKSKKQKGKTLFIDARKMGHMVDRKHRDFSDEDIQKLADAFTQFQDGALEDVKGFFAIANLQEIEKQDFILTSGRYVGIEDKEDDGEPFEEKMTRLTGELDVSAINL